MVTRRAIADPDEARPCFAEFVDVDGSLVQVAVELPPVVRHEHAIQAIKRRVPVALEPVEESIRQAEVGAPTPAEGRGVRPFLTESVRACETAEVAVVFGARDEDAPSALTARTGAFGTHVAAAPTMIAVPGKVGLAPILGAAIAIRVKGGDALECAFPFNTNASREGRSLAYVPTPSTVRGIDLHINATSLTGVGGRPAFPDT